MSIKTLSSEFSSFNMENYIDAFQGPKNNGSWATSA
jgi:hypothetical protein